MAKKLRRQAAFGPPPILNMETAAKIGLAINEPALRMTSKIIE
jgi:hypothetical protein